MIFWLSYFNRLLLIWVKFFIIAVSQWFSQSIISGDYWSLEKNQSFLLHLNDFLLSEIIFDRRESFVSGANERTMNTMPGIGSTQTVHPSLHIYIVLMRYFSSLKGLPSFITINNDTTI